MARTCSALSSASWTSRACCCTCRISSPSSWLRSSTPHEQRTILLTVISLPGGSLSVLAPARTHVATLATRSCVDLALALQNGNLRRSPAHPALRSPGYRAWERRRRRGRLPGAAGPAPLGLPGAPSTPARGARRRGGRGLGRGHARCLG